MNIKYFFLHCHKLKTNFLYLPLNTFTSLYVTNVYYQIKIMNSLGNFSLNGWVNRIYFRYEFPEINIYISS